MGIGDKIGNAAKDAAGKAKEGLGSATDNDRLQAEGKGDQLDASVGKATESAKDKASEVKDDVTRQL